MRKQFCDHWIAVALGNSRSLWGWFDGERLQHWQRCLPGQHPEWADRLDGEMAMGEMVMAEMVIAEVGAPQQRSPLLISRLENSECSDSHAAKSQPTKSSLTQVLTPVQVPLTGQYGTLGLDRSLALVGAASRWGWPVLVVDGGTALTVSAADENGRFAGGAILPGFGLQGAALHSGTAALPHIQFANGVDIAANQPERWATSTDGAIRSGIFYGILATVRGFYRDWCDRYPHRPVVFTGGDGELLHQALAAENSHFDPVLILQGMAVCRQNNRASANQGLHEIDS